MTPSISNIFADHVVNCFERNLPDKALDAAKKSILDTLGVIIGATGLEPSSRVMYNYMKEFTHGGVSTLFGSKHLVPAPMAAFANGAYAHCLDFDDHAPEGHHPSSSIIPVCLALAERHGNISGRDFLQAVAIGQDIFMRLRRNVVWKGDWHLTTVLAVFSATIAGAALLRLPPDKIASAIGIAGLQASGTYELVDGVNNEVRGYYAGFVSQQAINSVLLAEGGLLGPHSMLDGRKGFFNVFFDGKYDREAMLDKLGEIYQGQDVLYKPWPSCGISHSYIHAARKFAKSYNGSFEDIVKIQIHAGKGQLDLCEPLEKRIRPQTAADAKFSIPYTIALALVRGTVTPKDFLAESLKDERMSSFGEKMEVVEDPSRNWDGHLPTGKISVFLKDGSIVDVEGDAVPGSADAEMTWEELINKYTALVQVAPIELEPAAISQTVSMIRAIETLDNIQQLTAIYRRIG